MCKTAGFSHTLRRALTALALLFLIAPAALGDGPEFLIETVEVEGARYASPRIIVSESRLREGRSYSEQDLAAAIGRIERLPFIMYAEFRLRKGSEPGRYVLVVSIAETKPLFLSARSYSSWVEVDSPVFDGAESPAGIEFEPRVVDYRNDFLTVGGRWFVGARGVLHLAAEVQREDRYSLGYTQYDILGTRASVSALVSYQDRNIEGLPGVFGEWSTWDDVIYQFLATVPITTNQSIRASFQRGTQPVPRTELSVVPGNFRYRLIPANVDGYGIGWTFDTTNDALHPTAGTLVTASAVETQFALSSPDDTAIIRDENTLLSLTSERFLPVTGRQTISGGLDLHRRGIDEVRAHGKYALSLWDPRSSRGDLWFEVEADHIWLDGFGSDGTGGSSARAGLAFRNAWGLLRLDFEYVGRRDGE